jgi:hypothetical protein
MMKIRRVVTGHNPEGKSVVKWDSEIEAIPGRPGFSHVPLWATKQLPAKLTDEDPLTWDIGTSMAEAAPFVGTQPYNGLLALMVFFSNSDLKNDNNSLYEFDEPHEQLKRWFVVRDLGATLGETGWPYPRRNWIEGFERQVAIVLLQRLQNGNDGIGCTASLPDRFIGKAQVHGDDDGVGQALGDEIVAQRAERRQLVAGDVKKP